MAEPQESIPESAPETTPALIGRRRMHQPEPEAAPSIDPAIPALQDCRKPIKARAKER